MWPTRAPTPRDIEHIVEMQIRRWQQQRQTQEQAQDEEKREVWPLITVSREFGSLGSAVAEQVASALCFSFWDREIVQLVARQSGAEEVLVASLDERTRSSIEEFVGELLLGIEGTVAEYVRHVVRIVQTLERHGSAVIVGRGAQFVASPDRILRVRVICPRELRVARIAELLHISMRDAHDHVCQMDRERSSFVRDHFHRNVADPCYYDLVINTARTPVSAAADMILAAYRGRYPKPLLEPAARGARDRPRGRADVVDTGRP
jgi:hypothetical protein